MKRVFVAVVAATSLLVILALPSAPWLLAADPVRAGTVDWHLHPVRTEQIVSNGTAGAATPDVLEGVPICTDHNVTQWHPLVKRDDAGAILCTYGHEHHDDPRTADDVFGQVGAWASVPGQEISYPWQTSSSEGPENQVKHEGYKWYVATDQPCRPAWAAPHDGCFISWRVQVHSLGTASDAGVRFHSFSLEAVVEYHGERGIIRHGGHIDGGHLELLTERSPGTVCPPLPSNPAEFRCGAGVRRAHSGANLPAPYHDHSAYLVNWYSAHLVAQVGPEVEEWGPINFENPSEQLYYDAAVKGNNSNGRIENMAVQTSFDWLLPFRDEHGAVSYRGYTDRAGHQVSDCNAVGVDCVPLVIEGVPFAQYIFNSGTQRLTNNIEHDVASPATGGSLIRFPN